MGYNTLAEIYVSKTFLIVRAAAELVCKKKKLQIYQHKTFHCVFKALAFETLGL